jgi:Calx-beta domain
LPCTNDCFDTGSGNQIKNTIPFLSGTAMGFDHFLKLSVMLTLLVGSSSAALSNEVTTYSYDALGRVVNSSTSGTVNSGLQTGVVYDAAGNRANYTVTGSTPPTTAILSIGAASVTEGGILMFIISRSGITTSAVSVQYGSASGTAATGTDFTAVSGSLNFAANETSKTISVTTVNDVAIEPNETLMVTLSVPSVGAVLGTAVGTGTINDNDGAAPSFALSAGPAVTEGSPATFTVTKTGTTSLSYGVNYATNATGTATAGSDFTATSGTLTFAAADTSKTFVVSTLDDAALEATETIGAALSSPTGGATITTGSASASINDNDGIIVITDTNLIVLPAHQATYICSEGSFMSSSWSFCTLNNGSNIMVYNIYSVPPLDPGYAMPVQRRLEV